MASVQRCPVCQMLHGQESQQMLNLNTSFPDSSFVFECIINSQKLHWTMLKELIAKNRYHLSTKNQFVSLIISYKNLLIIIAVSHKHVPVSLICRQQLCIGLKSFSCKNVRGVDYTQKLPLSTHTHTYSMTHPHVCLPFHLTLYQFALHGTQPIKIINNGERDIFLYCSFAGKNLPWMMLVSSYTSFQSLLFLVHTGPCKLLVNDILFFLIKKFSKVK